MKNAHLALFLVLLLQVAAPCGFAQQTEQWRGKEYAYTTAVNLYQNGQFEASRRHFADYLQLPGKLGEQRQVDATFYHAMSTMELFHKDAEFLMENFILHYPESNRLQEAILALGNYNFNRRDYEDALRWLEQVDRTDLTSDASSEVTFKIAFSAFELEKYDLAKSLFFGLKATPGEYYGPSNYYYGHIAYTEGHYQAALEALTAAESDPNFAPVVPYYKAQILHFQDKHDELIAYATPLLEGGDALRENEIAHLIGNAWYEKQEYLKAVPYLERYIKSRYNPSPEEAYQMAYAYYRAGNYPEAINFFSKAAAAANDTLVQVATYQLADAYLKVGEKKYAQNAFKIASQSTADRQLTEDALFNYAKLAYELSFDPFHEAIQAFENYLETYPNSQREDEAYEFLMDIYLATANYPAALAALEKMKSLGPAERRAYQLSAYNLAVQQLVARKNEEALASFERSRKYPEDPALLALSHYWSGDIWYRQGNMEQAAKAYRTFAALPASFQTPYFNTVQYNLGYTALKADAQQEALTAFLTYVAAAKTDPLKKADALVRIGDLYQVQKNYTQAVESYQRALESNKAHEDYALYKKAQTYGYQDKYPEKIAALKELLQKYPESTHAAAARYELGDSYFMQNDLSAALAAFNAVIDNYAQSSFRKKALLKRGLVQYRLKNYEDAIATYKQVVADYGVDAESNEAVSALKTIYIDLGRIEDFSSWAAGLPDYELSRGELDSLTYQSAENLISEGNCDQAIKAFEDYLNQFPSGLFVQNAEYYIAECAYGKNDYDRALEGFERVLLLKAGEFTEPALTGAARIRFERRDYAKALEHYERLLLVSTFSANKLEAQLGIMRSAYKLDNLNRAMELAEGLLQSASGEETVVKEAKLTKGRVLFKLEQDDSALEVLEELAGMGDTPEGAEAQFKIAAIHYRHARLEEAEQAIFKLAKSFGASEYWKIRGFLLLAQIYRDRGDYFQAKATLNSLIENVTDPVILEEARAMLAEIAQLERTPAAEKSPAAADTLDYEDEYAPLLQDETK